MAHTHDAGDGRHRQAVLVGPADSFVTLLTQLVASPLKLGLAFRVVLGKGRQAAPGLRGLAFRTSDLSIV